MVTWPYTKALCANNDVDMAAAMVMCSARCATDLGISRDSWVFPWAATEAHDTLEFSARGSLARSPALQDAGRAVLAHSSLSIDDVTHIELYGCFPAIVEMTTDALAIDRRRQLTMTGGLGFAGSAMNTSTLHGLCAMVKGLRRQPGVGLVQGNGGNATHHAFGIYSSDPPAARPVRSHRSSVGRSSRDQTGGAGPRAGIGRDRGVHGSLRSRRADPSRRELHHRRSGPSLGHQSLIGGHGLAHERCGGRDGTTRPHRRARRLRVASGAVDPQELAWR